MSLDELLAALLGTKLAFESCLALVRGSFAKELVIRLLRGLDGEQTIDNAERERRLISVYARLSPSTSELSAIAEAAADLKNVVLRNALTQVLPPEFRSAVFRRRHGGWPESDTASELSSSQSEGQLEVTSPSSRLASDVAPFSDVIVLSAFDNPATKKLLESAAFVPLRCQLTGELDTMLAANEDICAFLIESSFVSSLNGDEQMMLITKLATFSTFAFLRFQDEGLIADPLEIGHWIAKARCRPSPPEVTQLSFQYNAALQERELSSIHNSRKRLGEGKAQGLFIPGELLGLELNLLGAAMSEYAKRRNFNPGAELTKVKTKFLHGGQTGARVALVRVNDLQVPVVVKLDRKEAILDEARRFLTFVHKDNPELNPEVHLHAGAALIVFGLIPDTRTETEEPAPTLEERLADYWYAEMRDPTSSDDGASLLKGFTDAAKRLAALNRQHCFNHDFSCKANPYLASLKAMEGKGFDWGFGEGALSVRDRAEQLLAANAGSSVCHGDAHTRNILIRGEQGFLIDYAYSGPGHPCSDLVKLELSVYLRRFFQFGAEADLAGFQRDLSIERLTFEELASKHKSLLHSKTNRLCLNMCVVARDLASQVLDAHGLSWDHYIAAKVLTAWQSLQVPSLQLFLARSIISSIGTRTE